MSLSEQDREILLQEIKQIQRTLEATGRNFGGEEGGFGAYSSDEEGQEYYWHNEGSTNSYYPSRFKQEENDDGDEDPYSPTPTPSVYNSYNGSYAGDGNEGFTGENDIDAESAEFISAANSESNFEDYSQNQITLNHCQSYSTAFVAPTESDVSVNENRLDSSIPQSSISAKLKQRIKQESQFKSNSTSDAPRSKNKVINSSSNNSIDTSLQGSLKSVPTKELEKINMANLYVERLFGGFRNRKSNKSSQHLIAVGEHKYGSRDLKSSANLSTLENLLQVNRRYKDLLTDELKKVELAIARNRRAQDEVVNTMQDKKMKNVTFASLSKACIGRFGNPYFKDNEGMGPPDNQDTIEKKRNVKVNPFNRDSKAWKNTETNALEEGVYHNNLEKRLEPYLKRLKNFDKQYKENMKTGDRKMDKTVRNNISKEIAKVKELPRKEIIQDPSQIDFFRISKNFLPTRDEFECRVQWCNVVHPSINQSKFSKDEDAMLIKLGKQYNKHQWETIAKDLDTNRTPIQCLQRYQRTLNRDMLKTTWDEDDDDQLRDAVTEYGNNWVLVAATLGDRTGDQCMHRWEKTLNPNIKRGKWSEQEDQSLLDAVKRLGSSSWSVVKKDIPGRTDAQCRERYVSTLDPSKYWGAFTEDEDKKIIELVRKHGLGKWAAIAKEFPSRRDNQIWRRYTQIEADNYHRYRRGVIWKRRSVLNYFFHRPSEKREYSLDELDVNYSPSLTHMESRKLERTREELVRCGYSEEEITKKLARMHYEGLFSRSMYKPRQRPFSQGRCKRDLIKKKTLGKLASEDLITEIKGVIATVRNPEMELPPPPSHPLKRKTKVARDVNLDGLCTVVKPDFKQKGRKETWQTKKVDGDTFRRKCMEVVKKFKIRTMWHEEAKSKLDLYYSIVQEAGNSFYHKIMLNIYSEESKKLQDLYDTYSEMKRNLLSQDTIPIKTEIDPTLEIKRPWIKKSIVSRKETNNANVNMHTFKKKKKMTTFKKMAADAARNIQDKKNAIETTPQIQDTTALQTTPKKPDVSKVKVEIVDESYTGSPITTTPPKPQLPLPLPSSLNNPQRPSNTVQPMTTNARASIANVQKPMGYVQQAIINALKPPAYVHNRPVNIDKDVKTSPTVPPQIVNSHKPAENIQNLTPTARPQIVNVQNSTPTVPPQIGNVHKPSAIVQNLTPTVSPQIGNVHQPTANVQKSTPTIRPRIVNIDTTKVNVHPTTPENNTGSIQQSPASNPNQTSNVNNTQPVTLTDQLKTFTLLLQALHVDTTGVMNSLSRNSSSNTPNSGILSSNSFPTCYPLSPNTSSLLGFRKLLLHRRILGEIVKQHQQHSERLGIPVARDLSYQNTKSYDALRKRFRSLFTWPAFLATFIPKYVDKPDVVPRKKSQVVDAPFARAQNNNINRTPNQLSVCKSIPSSTTSRPPSTVNRPSTSKRSSTTVKGSSTAVNSHPTNVNGPSTTVAVPFAMVNGPSTTANQSFTVVNRHVSETPLETLATVSEYVRQNREDLLKTSDSNTIKCENQNTANATPTPDDSETPTPLGSDTPILDSGNHNFNVVVEVKNIKENDFVNKYISERKLKDEASHSKKSIKKKNSTEYSRKRRLKCNILDTVNPSTCKKSKSNRDISNGNNNETVIVADETYGEIIKYVKKRKSQIEDVQVTVPISTKRRRGRRRREDRLSSTETIFIPPAIKVEVEEDGGK